MKKGMKRIIATLALAVVFHLAAVAVLPRAIMTFVSWKARQIYNAPVNSAIHPPRVTADQQSIVMPCPDLLYTLCVYDVSQNPLRIKVPAPQDTYFSVAMYAANTDNFFIVNDQQLLKDGREILLIKKGGRVPGSEKDRVVEAPTAQGIILCRTLIAEEDKLEDMIRIQHGVIITPVQ